MDSRKRNRTVYETENNCLRNFFKRFLIYVVCPNLYAPWGSPTNDATTLMVHEDAYSLDHLQKTKTTKVVAPFIYWYNI